jgi:glycine/D-amino acid oxidase-like deaminating enzyme
MKRIYEPYAYGNGPNADNFWQTTVGDPPDDPVASGSLSCEFAIIGAGFTGLNAAIELAQNGADVCVFDAKSVGWGASGRNGGFACHGGDKRSRKSLLRQHGPDEIAIYRKAQRAAIDQVADNLSEFQIDADRHSDGETTLAHRPTDIAGLQEEADAFAHDYGLSASMLPKDALYDHGLAGPEFHGAMTIPIGFAINPMKYVLGLARAARKLGVRIYAHSPVQTAGHNGHIWQLQTPNANITAKNFLLATNGYSSDDLPHWMSGRYLPVQSNILLTRPLTEGELADQGYTSAQMCCDTRNLLHYFRLMPDRRMLFGLRGALKTTEQSQRAMRAQARHDFDRMFPAWRHVETPYFWSGLLCLNRTLTPFAGPLGDLKNAWGAFGFHGNGVAMGTYAGRLMAEQALGRQNGRPCPDFIRATPRKFELGRFRRHVLRPAYALYNLKDKTGA